MLESVNIGSPRLQRQPTICLRGPVSKQNSLDDHNAPAHVAFEYEECEAINGRGTDKIFQSSKNEFRYKVIIIQKFN